MAPAAHAQIGANGPQLSANGVNYVNAYKALAMEEEQRTGVPAAITLAQGLHETEAGTSELVRNSNNHFGIKCKADWKGPVYYHDDDARGECFRVYATAADSYRDHSDFLRQGARYATLFLLDPADFVGWANGLRKAGYATNVRYSQILIRLIKDYHLEQYTLIALGKMAASDEVVLVAPGAPGVTVGSSSGDSVAGTGATENGDAAVGASETSYPQGEFLINRTRVVYVASGVSLLSVALKYDVPLGRLYDFNDMQREEVLAKGQLIFLQRKRRKGSNEYHVVKAGEDLYGIAQSEGVRLTDVLEMNQLFSGARPVVGERIYLQGSAPVRPRLVGEAQVQGGGS
jgi:LysM repeat protein